MFVQPTFGQMYRWKAVDRKGKVEANKIKFWILNEYAPYEIKTYKDEGSNES